MPFQYRIIEKEDANLKSVYRIKSLEITSEGNFATTQRGNTLLVENVEQAVVKLKNVTPRPTIGLGRKEVMRFDVGPDKLEIVIGKDGEVRLDIPEKTAKPKDMTNTELYSLMNEIVRELQHRELKGKCAPVSVANTWGRATSPDKTWIDGSPLADINGKQLNF